MSFFICYLILTNGLRRSIFGLQHFFSPGKCTKLTNSLSICLSIDPSFYRLPPFLRPSINPFVDLFDIRELKQARRRRQQNPHKFAYLTVKNSIFAHFTRAYFIFWHFEDILVLSTTWNDLFCSCVDDVSIWWQMFNFVLCPKRWFQFNSRIVGTHFSSKMTLNNGKMIAETRSYVFRWRSRFRRRRVCLSSLFTMTERWCSDGGEMKN